MTDSVKNKLGDRKWKRLLYCAGLCFAVFGIYLFYLYLRVESTFNTVNEFIPTRLYSDLYKITPGLTKSEVLRQLKALQYSFEETPEGILFTLHPPDYPNYLVPDQNHTLELAKAQTPLRLVFHNSQTLERIEATIDDVPELDTVYLEPELIATLGNTDGTRLIRDPISLSEVPAPLWKAIIAVEDPRFLDHPGIDLRGIARAIWVNLRTFSFAQGGSTLTLQLVKNLKSRRTKNIFEKFNELFLAILLELRYSKEQILERYLNEIFLGQVGSFEVHGVAEGARYFFDKNLNDLNLAEMALIAGVIRGPSFYSPYKNRNEAIKRQRFVLKRMVETGKISQEESNEATQATLQFASIRQVANRAPFFADYVKSELIPFLKGRMQEEEIAEAGLRVYTTLHTYLNSQAQAIVKQASLNLERNLKIPEEARIEGALASVEYQTGYVRSLVGGRDYATSNFNRILNMKRQVGSTFKPLVYLNLLLKGKDEQGVFYGPAYPVKDAPWVYKYDGGRQVWSPKNYEKDFLGWTTLRFALAQSINTIAAKMGVESGLESLVDLAKSLGVESDLKPLPSLSLGTAELSPIELLQVYSTLANLGTREDLTVIRSIVERNGTSIARFIPEPKPIFPSEAAYILNSMLESTFSIGTARSAKALGFTSRASGKTGTTSDYRDAWFAGSSTPLTTVVWVGFDQPGQIKSKKPIRLTGAGSALPIWTEVMKLGISLYPKPLSHNPFSKDGFEDSDSETVENDLVPKGIVRVKIDMHSGRKAKSDCPENQVIDELYLEDIESSDEDCATTYENEISDKSEL